MGPAEIFSQITRIGIVPVVRAASAESAIQAVEAIYRGGIRVAEITMTVPGAVRALEIVADQLGGKIVLGAGTVLDPETARTCVLAGAQFIVTPGLKLATIEIAKRRLFSAISRNWAGEPLQSYEKILKFIRTTTTTAGLK